MGIDHSNPYIHSTTVLCDRTVMNYNGVFYWLYTDPCHEIYTCMYNLSQVIMGFRKGPGFWACSTLSAVNVVFVGFFLLKAWM